MTNTQIENRLKKLENLKAAEKELKSQIETIENELKKELENVETIETKNYILRYTLFESSRFDTANFKKTHIDLYNEFLKISLSRRFSFSSR